MLRRTLLRSLVAAPAMLPARGGGALGSGAPVPVSGYSVVASYPHDPNAFTEGLVWTGGVLLEGTGLAGESELRRVDLETGDVLQRQTLPADQFGEGIALLQGRIYQLTWQSGVCHVWDATTLAPIRTYRYGGEGWGLTTDGRRLYMSDGSATITVRNRRFKSVREIKVTERGQPVRMLNELEWVDGEIWANVWMTDEIVRIDPRSGRVVGRINLSGLVDEIPEADRPQSGDAVLNGIAHDPETGRLLVAGKLWPLLFEITLVPPA